MKRKSAINAAITMTLALLLVIILFLAVAFCAYLRQLFQQDRLLQEKILQEFLMEMSQETENAAKQVQDMAGKVVFRSELSSADPLRRSNSRQDVQQYMNELLASDTAADFLVVQCSPLLLIAASDAGQTQEMAAFYGYFRTTQLDITGTVTSTGWKIIQIGQKFYFYQSASVLGYCIAAFRSVEQAPIFSDLLEENGVLGAVLSDSDGEVIMDRTVLTESQWDSAIQQNEYEHRAKTFYTIEQALDNSNYRLEVFYRQMALRTLLENMSVWVLLLGAMASFVVAMLVAMKKMLAKEVMVPTRELLEAFQAVQQGNLGYQIPERQVCREFRQLNEGFNRFSAEIRDLKIAEYENKVEQCQTQIRQLQSQIRTHFYLNAFTTIQSMTYQDRIADIRTYLLALSKHMRYMMRITRSMVPLQEELAHIRNYFEMQNIKFPGSVCLEIGVLPEEPVEVPHLAVCTMAENTIKHAMSLETTLHVRITFHTGENGTSIFISDNGPGFPEKMLNRVNWPEPDGGAAGGIGIRNVDSTLELIYGQPGLLQLGNNSQGGACVEIRIPRRKEHEG